MRVSVGMLLFLYANTASLAQRTTPPKAVPTGVVTGHVYCADTNGPARLANVVLEPADAIDGYASSESKGVSAHMSGVQTLPDGSFSVQHVTPGTYYVFASEPGYVSPLAAVAATSDQLSKPDKATRAEIAKAVPRVTVQASVPAAIEVTLQRGAAVSGTVLYDDGSPAAGLQVQLLVRQKEKWVEPREGPVQGTPSTITDDRGVFRISGLPAREYLIAVQLSLNKTSYDVGDGGFSTYTDDYRIPVYSGNKLRPKDAAPFTLKLGEERPGEDITIPLAKLHNVTGSIAAARDGHTVNGGHVALLYADDRSEAANTKLAKGDTGWTLSFVPEGDYIVRVSDGADLEYEEIPNNPDSVPPTHTESHAVHHYGPGEQPLHVEGEVSGLAVSVPELGTKKAQGSQ
jgi:hypothetical protein